MSDKVPERLRPYCFTTENQPKNRGRKPARMNKFLKDNGLTADDMRMIIKFVFGKSEGDLRKILLDKTIPMVVRLFVKVFLNDFNKSTLTNTNDMLNRVFGSPVQKIDQTTHEGEPDVTNLSPEERNKILEQFVDQKIIEKKVDKDNVID